MKEGEGRKVKEGNAGSRSGGWKEGRKVKEGRNEGEGRRGKESEGRKCRKWKWGQVSGLPSFQPTLPSYLPTFLPSFLPTIFPSNRLSFQPSFLLLPSFFSFPSLPPFPPFPSLSSLPFPFLPSFLTISDGQAMAYLDRPTAVFRLGGEEGK